MVQGIIIAIVVILVLLNIALKIYENIKNKELKKQEIAFNQRELFNAYKDEVQTSLHRILEEKGEGFPWLASAIADYWENYDNIFAEYLRTKKRPAVVQSVRIKEIAKEKKLFKKEFLTAKYIINYYESLFPWLREYVGFSSDELIRSIYLDNTLEEEEDPVSFYITKSEFEKLSVSERNQKALDRYWNRDKDPWQIGRDYERYIGYLYQANGFKVQYHGIERLKEDLGRDLICTRGRDTEIVQCKYWSHQKGIPIRENHITQLYGTTIKYLIDSKRKLLGNQIEIFANTLSSNNIFPVIITTTELSDTAKEFAEVLGIVVNNIPMDKSYPCIKCNINFQTNERIYHLPFDQQYDNTHIDVSKGEYWVKTVKEAEDLGFRRAWRWKPNQEII